MKSSHMPKTTGKEKVLVFPSWMIQANGGFEERSVVTDLDKIQDYIDTIFLESTYIDRDHAETDDKWLQIIPYTLLMRGREIFRYRRTKKGGESRLHDKWSVGVGGHVNPGDGEGNILAYWKAFDRELAEEVSPDRAFLQNEIIGLIYDQSTEVGRVHFGIVHKVRMNFDTVLTFNDPSLADGSFEHITDLKAGGKDFENWSQLVLKEIL